MEGGCECGAVRYRLTDMPVTVNCCHCRDCQRITGSAFALNAMIESDRIAVTQGAPEMRSLEREGQGDTHAWRCAICETLLWADHPMMGDAARFVRIGTLDRAEALAPDAHYFVRSRHPWVTPPAGVPAFDTLPSDDTAIDLPPDRAARMAMLLRAGEQPGA
ncbi:hypothetical protein ASG29_06070 [Sphingomonas sp. Leaf412]|nr:hypothetical protein ASG29_06070 [Sphingomonas sp. Leaf412]